MKIFLICPVRGMTSQEEMDMAFYAATLKKEGHHVHWPPVDTNQNDPIGLRICSDNRRAILEADEIHILWTEKSKGSLFDFGMAFGLMVLLEKKIVLINPEEVEKMVEEENQKGIGKSFNKVLLELHKRN